LDRPRCGRAGAYVVPGGVAGAGWGEALLLALGLRFRGVVLAGVRGLVRLAGLGVGARAGHDVVVEEINVREAGREMLVLGGHWCGWSCKVGWEEKWVVKK
jgi:hypothetical protein